MCIVKKTLEKHATPVYLTPPPGLIRTGGCARSVRAPATPGPVGPAFPRRLGCTVWILLRRLSGRAPDGRRCRTQCGERGEGGKLCVFGWRAVSGYLTFPVAPFRATCTTQRPLSRWALHLFGHRLPEPHSCCGLDTWSHGGRAPTRGGPGSFRPLVSPHCPPSCACLGTSAALSWWLHIFSPPPAPLARVELYATRGTNGFHRAGLCVAAQLVFCGCCLIWPTPIRAATPQPPRPLRPSTCWRAFFNVWTWHSGIGNNGLWRVLHRAVGCRRLQGLACTLHPLIISG
jgi:hypothetical protein